MSLFPISCVDDFYSNPDEVREYALSLDYKKIGGDYPGERTEYLDSLNIDFFRSFTSRLFSLYFDFYYTEVSWTVLTSFQKTYPYENDKFSHLNSGWQHTDDEHFIAAGVIYLNKVSDLDGGTSFYRLKDPSQNHIFDYNIRNKLYNNEEINKQEYINQIKNHDSHFEKTLEVKNVYNRMIMYQSDIWHKESNFYVNNFEPRLTQIFFIKELTCESAPIPRKNSYEITI